jgi:cell division protein FtsX
MKLRTLRYHIQEGVSGVFKNGLMSLASIAVVGACIFIVIISLCLAVNIDYILEQLEANVGISVMFGETPDEAQIAGVEESIKKIPHVTSVQYYSKDDALDQAKEMFDADALEGLREDNPLPRSFDIKVDSIANQPAVIKALEELQLSFEQELTSTDKKAEESSEDSSEESSEDVSEESTAEVVTNEAGAVVPQVIDEGITEATTIAPTDNSLKIGDVGYVYQGIEKIKHAQDITNALVTINIIVRVFSLIIIAILSVISVGIIMNTIKLTVFIRKSEINIMKYVGATDWFIRWPFVIEGIVIGLIGAVIPCVVCWLGYDGMISYISSYDFLSSIAQLKSASDIFFTIAPIALVIGVLLGVIGSISSLERHLNV